jgi:hypothetical protein
MDPYTSERWILETHQAVMREAERRARLAPEPAGEPGVVSSWIAWRLRELADRLDDRRGHSEKLRPSA